MEPNIFRNGIIHGKTAFFYVLTGKEQSKPANFLPNLYFFARSDSFSGIHLKPPLYFRYNRKKTGLRHLPFYPLRRAPVPKGADPPRKITTGRRRVCAFAKISFRYSSAHYGHFGFIYAAAQHHIRQRKLFSVPALRTRKRSALGRVQSAARLKPDRAGSDGSEQPCESAVS